MADGRRPPERLDAGAVRQLGIVAARAADAKQASETVVIDVGEVLGITDLFVITSGSNDRQVRTIADEIQRRMKEAEGMRPLRMEGLADARWVLMDYGSIVVHVFHTEARQFYDLERLWRDLPRLDWQDPSGDGHRDAAAGGD